MGKYKIFIASSAELKEDRDQFELLISTRNYRLFEKGILLEIVRWENFSDAMAITRLQDEYDRAVAESDIFMMLFYTKVGKYTEEEFDTAFDHFKEKGKPLVYTYFKDAESSKEVPKRDVLSLKKFKKKLSDMGHFYSTYKSIDELKNKFGEQLNILVEKGLFKMEEKENPGNVNQTTNVQGNVDKIVNVGKVDNFTMN